MLDEASELGRVVGVAGGAVEVGVQRSTGLTAEAAHRHRLRLCDVRYPVV